MTGLTAANLGNVVRYCRKSSEGYQSDLWCVDGLVHVEHGNDAWPENTGTRITGPCDSSCKERADVRKFLSDLPARYGQVPFRKDKETKRLLRGTEPLMGIHFEHGYCKRDSEWLSICTGSHHVATSTSLCRENGRPEGVRVRTCPCDGSCKGRVTMHRRLISIVLRAERQAKELEERKRQWRAERQTVQTATIPGR